MKKTDKPLLIGECSFPPGTPPMSGRSGRFLARLLGLEHAEFLRRFECVNLLRRWPGRSGGAKGHLFDAAAGTRSAGRLDLRGRRVVLLGRRVAACFGLRSAEFMLPVSAGRREASCVVLPHPSGVVRWWNAAENRARVGRLLKRLAEARKTKKASPKAGRRGRRRRSAGRYFALSACSRSRRSSALRPDAVTL